MTGYQNNFQSVNPGSGGGGASSFSELSGSLDNTQIPNGEITVAKLNITGTPDGTKFLRDDGTWQSVAGGGEVDFGDLTGTLDVTQVPDGELTIAKTSGLQTALDAKAAATHSHSISDVTGLQTELDNKVETLSDLGLTADATELNYIDGVTSAVQTQLDGKAASSHSHAISDVTGLQDALDDKLESVAFTDLSGTLDNTQISDGEIGVAKLNVTGTPDGTKFLRDDGSWQTVSGGGGSTIDISLTTPGDSDPYFEVSKDGSDNVVIVVGSGSGAPNGGLTWSSSQGSWFFSSGFTSVTIDSNGWAIPSDKSIRFQEPILEGDNYAEIKSYQGGMSGNYTLYMPPALGNEGDVVTLGSAGQLSFTPPTVATRVELGSAATGMTITIPSDTKAYTIAFSAKSAVSSNRLFITFNGDTSETGYTTSQCYNSGASMTFSNGVSNLSTLLQNLLSSGVNGWGTVHVWRFYDGTNTTFFANGHGVYSGGVLISSTWKTVAGDVALTSVSVRSNQTNGLDAGSKIELV